MKAVISKNGLNFIIIGIEHFYLYNNFSSDNYLEVLEPYIQAGEVTLTDWPVPQGQMSAYQDCFNRFRDETNWLAFIDIDEFIIPNKTDTIGEFLKPFEKRPAILIYWRFFGASGLIDRDINGLVVEDFRICEKKYATIGKIIFNTAYNLDGSHKKNRCLHHLSWGSYHNTMLPPVNCFGKFVLYDIHHVNSHDLPVQINHYLTKSYKEFFDRKALKGDVFFASFEDGHYSKYFWSINNECYSLDLHAYKYIIPLKLSMSDKSVLMHNMGGVKLLRAFAFTKSNEFKLAA